MNFKTLPPESRIWIFQSDRKLTPTETQNIMIDANQFTRNWVSHNKDLTAAAEVYHDRFLILAINEGIQTASGCSIDSSTSFIGRIEKKYKVNLLNRDYIAFFIEEKIRLIQLKEIRQSLEN